MVPVPGQPARERERERESAGETGGLSGESLVREKTVEEHHTGQSPVRIHSLHSPLHSRSFLSHDDINTMVAVTINN